MPARTAFAARGFRPVSLPRVLPRFSIRLGCIKKRQSLQFIQPEEMTTTLRHAKQVRRSNANQARPNRGARQPKTAAPSSSKQAATYYHPAATQAAMPMTHRKSDVGAG